MKSRKKEFKVSGMYHPLLVKLVTQRWLNKYTNDTGILGTYEHNEGLIHIAKEQSPQVKTHTFYHEIAHHILLVLEDVENEENKCDLLASYLIKLLDDKEFIESELSK